MEFLYIIKPHKENFVETMTDEESNIMSQHSDYITKLLDDKILVLAGPELSGKFGIVIFNAKDKNEAESIMLKDPAIKNKIVTVELHPFRVSFLQK